MAAQKMWGRRPFWGVDSHMDPEWMLTEEHKELQQKVMEICRTTIRPNAKISDETYEFPRKSLDALGEIGVLGMNIPKDLGGLQLDHVSMAMVVETVARYGCPSTAMVLVMHLTAVECLVIVSSDRPTCRDTLRKVNSDKFIGTIMISDPSSGGHFWYQLSCKVHQIAGDSFQVLKYGSWCTSGGFADFYVSETNSVAYDGDYTKAALWLVFKEEVRANSDDWQSMGLRGNQSGPVVVEGILSADRLIGEMGQSKAVIQLAGYPISLLGFSACWCGVAMAIIDVAKRHVTNKYHADVGRRVCDYPTIQDYFGESVISTNTCRAFLFGMAQTFDMDMCNRDYSRPFDPTSKARARHSVFLLHLKYVCAKTVGEVGETMLHACGGAGYNKDMDLERLIRDGKAGWIMAMSNEVVRQEVGKMALMGLDAMDLWATKLNKRQVIMETMKMSADEKEALAKQLLHEAEVERSNYSGENEYQGTDFDNPFNIEPPRPIATIGTSDGVNHAAALNQDGFVRIQLKEWKYVADKVAEFSFQLPKDTDHLGCMPGQYIQIRAQTNGKTNVRFFSPTSAPTKYGVLELVTRFECQGIVSQHLKALKSGDYMDARGPCGGYEYKPGTLQQLTLISSGVGCTPALQLVRCIAADPWDPVKVTLVHFGLKPADIFFKEELESFATTDNRLKLHFTVRDADDSWTGSEGFITKQMLQTTLAAPGASDRHRILLCGGPGVVITILQFLKELGYTSDQMFIYGQFGVEHIRKIYGRKARLGVHKSD